MSNGADNGADKGTENESPFVADTGSGDELQRTELMKKTAKQLTPFAMPYVALKQSTLERMAKPDLCDIILSKGQVKGKKESTARASKTTSDSEAIINTVIAVIESFKVKREEEPLDASAKEIFKNNAVNIVDKKVDDGVATSSGVNTAVAIVSGLFLVVDGLIGLKNVPTLLSKLRKKPNATSTK